MKNKKGLIFGTCFTLAIATAVACSSKSEKTENGRAVIEQRVIRGPDGGWIMEDAGYCCYDYITNSCHHAANCGVAAGNDGIISCTGATGGPYGHTVNWDRPDPSNPRLVCAAEPQRPGSPACCWTDNNASGPPDLNSPGAQACVAQLCGSQYTDGGAVAFDGGWDVTYLDCAGNSKDGASCERCCDANADAIPGYWGDAAVEDRENYRKACKQRCKDRFGAPPPAPTSTSTSTTDAPKDMTFDMQ
jgi:hypothetical protein